MGKMLLSTIWWSNERNELMIQQLKAVQKKHKDLLLSMETRFGEINWTIPKTGKRQSDQAVERRLNSMQASLQTQLGPKEVHVRQHNQGFFLENKKQLQEGIDKDYFGNAIDTIEDLLMIIWELNEKLYVFKLVPSRMTRSASADEPAAKTGKWDPRSNRLKRRGAMKLSAQAAFVNRSKELAKEVKQLKGTHLEIDEVIKKFILSLDTITYVSQNIGTGKRIGAHLDTWYECDNSECPMMKQYHGQIPVKDEEVHTLSQKGCPDLVLKTAEECKSIEHVNFKTVETAFKCKKAKLSIAGDQVRELKIKRKRKKSKKVTFDCITARDHDSKLNKLATYIEAVVHTLLAEWMNAEECLRRLREALNKDGGFREVVAQIPCICNGCLALVKTSETECSKCHGVDSRRLLSHSLSHDRAENDDEISRRLLSSHFRRLFEVRDPAYQRELLRRLRLRNQSNEKQRKNSS